jgi:hypothetical protein
MRELILSVIFGGPCTYSDVIMQHVQPFICNRRINNGVMQPISRQRIGKHVPTATNTNTTIALLLETVFSTPSVQSRYKEDNWSDPVSCQLRVEFCKGDCEDRTWAREAEESPLLEAVAKERLMKTQQAGKRLSGCCGDLWIVALSDSAVITCVCISGQ